MVVEHSDGCREEQCAADTAVKENWNEKGRPEAVLYALRVL
jgi:hypothetical protein